MFVSATTVMSKCNILSNARCAEYTTAFFPTFSPAHVNKLIFLNAILHLLRKRLHIDRTFHTSTLHLGRGNSSVLRRAPWCRRVEWNFFRRRSYPRAFFARHWIQSFKVKSSRPIKLYFFRTINLDTTLSNKKNLRNPILSLHFTVNLFLNLSFS